MHKCNYCSIEKTFNEMVKNKARINGTENICKRCKSEKARERNNSENGRLRYLFTRFRSSTSKHNKIAPEEKRDYPDFNLSYFIEWAYLHKYKSFYDCWKKSGFKKDLCPSIYRIDCKKGYVSGNIELVTWQENRTKAVKNKETTGKKSGKELLVDCYFSGVLVKTFKNMTEASNSPVFNCSRQTIRYSIRCNKNLKGYSLKQREEGVSI